MEVMHDWMAFSSVQIKVSLKSSMLRAEMGNALQVTRYKYKYK